MMRLHFLLWLALLGLLWTLPAPAADVAGKWKAEFTSPDGEHRVNTFTFKADGEKLTGTVAGSQDETPLQDGKISGTEISFSAERPFGRFTYKGTIDGNEIKLKVEFNDNHFEITARRVSD